MLEARHKLDATKQEIGNRLLNLGDRVKTAIEQATGCLEKRDVHECLDIIKADQPINDIWRLLEKDCLVAIASQQPVASDLREIVACMRITGELERIGDYAADIAKIVLQMEDDDLSRVGLDTAVELSAVCTSMLGNVLDAFQRRDTRMAREVAVMDNLLDRRHEAMVETLLPAMEAYPKLVYTGSRMLWIAHLLERCGDRATNIAEQVLFMVEAEDVALD